MKFIIFLLLLGVFYSLNGQETYNVLGIRAEFQEDDSDLTTGNGKFDLSVSTAPYQIDPPPHNKRYFADHIIAVGDYFENVSSGKVNISGDIFPVFVDSAYQLPEKMAYYNPNLGDEKANEGLAKLFRDALLEADKDLDIDFAQFNCVVVFHAGVGKDISLGFDETPEDIPSLYISPEFLEKYLGQSEILLRNGTVSIDRGIVLPETESQVGYSLAINGIFAANMGSFLGLPDLFDVEEKTPAIGAFGLMDAGFFNFAGLLPSRPMAWNRYNAGWEMPVTIVPGITETKSVSSQVDSIPAVYRIQFSTNESFWIEHRWNGNFYHDSLLYEASSDRDTLMTYREYLTEIMPGYATFDSVSGVMIKAVNYDFGLPASGIMIWRIDDRVIAANIDQNRINADKDYRGISVIEADGANDIGQNYDLFDPGYGSQLGYQFDFWYEGNPMPFYENIFNSNSFPPAVSHYTRAKSGVMIENFSNINEVMQFDIKNEFFVPGYPYQLNEKSVSYYAGGFNLQWGEDSVRVFDEAVLLEIFQNLFNHTDSLDVSHYYGIDRLLVAHDNNRCWIGQFDEPFSLNRSDSIHVEDIISVALGNRLLAIIHSDTISQYQINPTGISLLDKTQIYGDPLPAYLDEQIYLFDSSVHLSIQGSASIFQPIFETYSQTWWVLTREGELLIFNKELNNVLLEKDLGLLPENQPILSFNSSSNQEFPAIFFIADDQMHAFTLKGYPGENFPVDLNDFGKSDGSEIIVGHVADNKVFLARSIDGIIIVVDPTMGLRKDLSLKIDGPSPYWLETSGIHGLSDGLNRIAFANGITDGLWNGPGGNDNPYQINLPAAIIDPGSHLFEKESVYNWPNPNLENHTFIRLRLNTSATVNIKVVDLVGDPVMQTSFFGNEGINEYRWDLSNVSSGVYFARVEADGGGRKEYSIIKIMVIK